MKGKGERWIVGDDQGFVLMQLLWICMEKMRGECQGVFGGVDLTVCLGNLNLGQQVPYFGAG